MKLFTTKGNREFESVESAQSWLDELQPSHATLEFASKQADVDDSVQQAMDDCKQAWVDWANEVLEESGIGKYENTAMWYHYQLADDGSLLACDYSEALRVEWDDLPSHGELIAEGASYVEATK